MSTTTTPLKVVAFTQNAVYAGDLGAPGDDPPEMALVGSGDSALYGPDIESAYMVDPYDGKTKLFAVDGTDSIIVDVIGNELVQWADRVITVGKGELPPQCALICVYRGRMVLARQPSQPSILYLSRSLDPYDWQFGALPLATTPIAATDPTLSQPADAIMCLIPFNQDYLVIGCLSSIYVIVGDPGYGGSIQLGSRRTGLLGPRCFCFDENGVCYILGNSGLFRMVNPLQPPEPLTGRKLIGLLDRIDTTDANGIRPELKYDAFKKEIHIYLTPRDDHSQGTHVIVDRETGACWLDKYPITHGPHSALEIDGEEDDNRRILIGGNDGYVRRWKSLAKSDDGTEINSYFDSAPIEIGEGTVESTATELQPFFKDGSDDVTWEWYAGNSPEAARTSTAVETSGTFEEGYTAPVGLRVTAGSHRLRIKQLSRVFTWGLEKLFAKFIPANRRR